MPAAAQPDAAPWWRRSVNLDPGSRILSTLRAAAALGVIGLLAKAMGLVVTVLVARFLGPEGLGLFALLLAATLLLEQVARFGLPELLIRDAAAQPDLAGLYWRNGVSACLATAVLPTVALIAAAFVVGDERGLRPSLLLMAAGMPLAAAAGVGQSLLQARGQVPFVTSVSFVARAASLLVLVGLLSWGMGVTAAFVSRVVFEGGMGIAFAARLRALPVPAIEARLPLPLLKRALPFAISRALGEGNLRAPLLLVSVALALAEVGVFDAADRVALSFQAIVAASVTALIPLFARTPGTQDADGAQLIGYSLKYTTLLVASGAFMIAACARPLTTILFGEGFAQSADLLPALLLTQVLAAAVVVVRQALVAHGREYTVTGAGMLALALKLACVAALLWPFGLPGATWGVLLATFLTFATELVLARRAGIPLDVPRFVLRPVTCVVAAFGILWLVPDRVPFVQLALGPAIFLLAAAISGLFPIEERRLMLETVRLRLLGSDRSRSPHGRP